METLSRDIHVKISDPIMDGATHDNFIEQTSDHLMDIIVTHLHAEANRAGVSFDAIWMISVEKLCAEIISCVTRKACEVYMEMTGKTLLNGDTNVENSCEDMKVSVMSVESGRPVDQIYVDNKDGINCMEIHAENIDTIIYAGQPDVADTCLQDDVDDCDDDIPFDDEDDKSTLHDNHHTTDNHQYKCSICLTTFQHAHALKLHVAWHSQTTQQPTHFGVKIRNQWHRPQKKVLPSKQQHLGLHKCTVCSDAFQTEDDLHGHLAEHKCSNSCTMCPKSYLRRAALREHIVIAHTELAHKCDVCPKAFGRKTYLQAHLQMHAREKSQPRPKLAPKLHKCTVCQAGFNTTSDLDGHLSEHMQENSCNLCEKSYLRPAALREHIMLAHKDSGYSAAHKCTVCSEGFGTTDDLEAHISEHKRENTCEMCGKSYLRRAALREHIVISHKELNHKCDVCPKAFGRKTYLQAHLQMHARESSRPRPPKKIHTPTAPRPSKPSELGPNQCTVCLESFDTADELQSHLLAHKQENQCTMCPKSYLRRAALREHVVKVHYELTHKCEVCQKAFGRKSNLRVHMKTHARDKPPKLLVPNQCTVCLQVFDSADDLQEHLSAHKDDNSCHLCEKTYLRRSSLREHVVIAHTGIAHKCDVCGKVFGRKGVLQEHIKTHTGEKSELCAECGMAFKTKRELNIHGTVHTGEKPYKCPICGKDYRKNSDMNAHRRAHDKTKCYQCAVCGVQLGSPQALRMHAARHTVREEYTCDICDKKFLGKAYLDRHVRSHSGEKPWPCPLCPLEFMCKSGLKSHTEASHSDIGPFECPMCSVKYSRSSNLRVHMRKIHTVNGVQTVKAEEA